jgi:hypothetical protein
MIQRVRQSANSMVVFIILCHLLLFHEASAAGYLPPSPGQTSAPPLARVLILPVVDMTEIHGHDATLRGPLSGEVFITDTTAPGSAESVEETLRNRLVQLKNVHLIAPSAEIIGALRPLTAGNRSEKIAAIRNAGRRSGADAVLCTYLYAFRERVGVSYGAETPARVSFEVVLVSVATGAVIWQGSFSETQKPLSEDLLGIGKFLQRRGRWVTASEMTAKAIDDMIDSLAAVGAGEENT